MPSLLNCQSTKIYSVISIKLFRNLIQDFSHLEMQDSSTQKLVEEKFRSETFITKVVLNISISCILIGYSSAYFSAIDYADFVQIFQVTQYQAFYQGFLTGSVPLTASIGGFIAAYLLKKFSRKQCFLVANSVYVVILFGLMIKDLKSLIFFRLLQGLMTGIFTSIAPLYSKQFSPLQLNGKMGTFFQMLTVFGLSLAFLMSWLLSMFFSPQLYWRMIFIFPLFLIAFQSYNLTHIYNYETPKYLLSVGRNEQARQLLQIIYKDEYVQQRLLELKKMFSLSSNKNVEMKQFNKQSNIQSNNLEKDVSSKEEIKYHNNKIAVYAAIHISTLQQFSGISVVIGYGAQIVKSVFPALAKVLPIFLHLEAVVACFFTISLLKNYGRKTLCQFGSFGCGILTLMLGYTIAQISNSKTTVSLGSGLLILISLFTYRFIYGVTIGPVAFLYIPEIVEPNVMPLIIVLYWFSASMTMILFPILKLYVFDGNPGPIFIGFAAYTLLSLFINHLVLVETKGRKQYEVRQQYDRMLGIQANVYPQQLKV